MVRFGCLRVGLILLIGVAVCGTPLSAQQLERITPGDDAAATLVAPTQPSRITPNAARVPERRPEALVPLYASFCTLQALDIHSTWRALDRGAVEANPVLRGVVGNQVGLIGLKVAGTAGIIYASEKIWKKNKTASLVFMIAANSAMAWVVQNNYRAVR